MPVAPPCGDILIVGGGVVGLCCAWHLQTAGMRTIIVDPDQLGRAPSSGNAGHLAIEQVEPLASPAMIRSAWRKLALFGGPVSLRAREVRAWAPFLKAMAQSSGKAQFEAGKLALGSMLAEAMPAWRRLTQALERPDLMIERGHVILWQNARRAAHDIAAWRQADTGTARYHVAGSAELARLAETLRLPLSNALIFENTGQIVDLDALLLTLKQRHEAAGGQFITGLVSAITHRNGRITVMLENGTSLAPAAVLVTAGVGTGRLLAGLGQHVPLIAERGYHIHAVRHDWPADLPPIVFQDRSIIVTRFENGLRIAGFAEFGHPGAAPDPRRWAKLKRHAAQLGIPIHEPLTCWMGSRPTLPDYRPAIGRISNAPNVIYAFGHQHLGLTLAPVTAELVGRLVAGALEPSMVGRLSLARFGRSHMKNGIDDIPQLGRARPPVTRWRR